MHPLRKQRLYIVLFIVIGASVAAALVFWALRDNMNFFYAPAQVAAGEAPAGKTIRVGGLVVPGSLRRSDSGLEVGFTVTDNQAERDYLQDYVEREARFDVFWGDVYTYARELLKIL